MITEPFRVIERVQDTADTWTLTFAPLDGEGPVIGAGQFVMAYAFGVGEIPISVSGAPGRAGPVVLTIRAVGAVTNALCAAQPGTIVGLRGPFGNTWPVEAAMGGDVVVVAGGIGLAPLRPVVLAALESRTSFGEVAVLYGARTPADLLYPDELLAWRSHAQVEVTVDSPGDGWDGRVGVVPALLDEATFDPDTTTAFVCGPEIMIHFTAEALLERGVAAERIAVSLERDMRCGVGLCGHCQLGPTLICRDGPVYTHADIAPWLAVHEL